MFIFYILSMCFSHKRYDQDENLNEHLKDLNYLMAEIAYSIFIYLVILPVFYCLF